MTPMPTPAGCCLLVANRDAVTPPAVPLRGVRVAARLVDRCAEVTVTQRYRNEESTPIEAVYVFPLEEGAAVCRFAARLADRTVEGKVEAREKAFETYDDAMMEGHGAFLLDQERPDVFTASVGNLLPGEEVEIEVGYVALADQEGAATRLTIPTTVSPRYVPPDHDAETVGEPDGQRVNPPRWATVPYGLTLTAEVDAPGALRVVESPSHTVRTVLRDGGATVTLTSDDVALDRDFVLVVEAEDAHQPAALVAADDEGQRFAMVTFRPEPPATTTGVDVVFLLDCSGSMQGGSIEQARKALALAIRSLGEGDRFDVVRFGTRYEALYGRMADVDDASLDRASQWATTVQADLGGTEILAPLQHLYERRTDGERQLQILLLTDGQVSNEADVAKLCGLHAKRARVFTFGIGAGASQFLVREVARASGGVAEMIAPGERIAPKVLRTFRRVRTPAFDDVSVDWGGLDVDQAPKAAPSVFAGDAVTLFARVRSGATDSVTLSAGGESWTLPLDLEVAGRGGPVPSLWARHRIRDLEAGAGGMRGSAQRRGRRDEKRREELVELGRRYGLLSSETSYVAVYERAAGERADGPAELRKVPIALTKGWGGVGQPRTQTLGMRARARVTTGAMPPPAAMAPSPAPLRAAQARSAPAGPASGAGGFFDKVKSFFGGDAIDHYESYEDGAAAFAPAETTMFLADDPAPKRAPRQAAVATDALFDVLMTQRVDGSFPLTDALRAWLGDRAAEVDAAAGGSPEVLATAVVLWVLEREHADRRDEWAPAADKARRWLDAQADVPDVDELFRG